MKHFEDTCTLCIEFRDLAISKSRGLDENAIMDLYANGNVCAMTFEHASARTDVQQVTLEGTAA